MQSWPIGGLTTKWFGPAIHNGDMQQALWLSLEAASFATLIALVLGTLASFGVHRFRFFGREAISFLLVLPIALPGIITGMALNSYFTYWKLNFGLLTIVIGHATFCVVVVYNNVIARLRRVPGSLTEASMDLGADGWQTFRYVTFPTISTALISGGLLAFALSFDEVIVTTFTAGAQNTLPIWIFGQIRLGQQLPQVNVVVFLILAVTIIPVAVAQRLTRESGILRTESRCQTPSVSDTPRRLSELGRGRSPLARLRVRAHLLGLRRARDHRHDRLDREQPADRQLEQRAAVRIRPGARAPRRARDPRPRSRARAAACPPQAARSRETFPVRSPLASGKYGMNPSPSRAHVGSSSASASRRSSEYSLCSETYASDASARTRSSVSAR